MNHITAYNFQAQNLGVRKEPPKCTAHSAKAKGQYPAAENVEDESWRR